MSSDWLWFWNIKYSPFSVISQPRPSPDNTLRYIPSNFHNLLFSEPGMRWKIENKSKSCPYRHHHHHVLFLDFKAELKLCWQKYIIPKYFSFIPLLLPPTNNSAPLWCMKGGRGNFSRTFNIFFFIHCTGVCLYRILIAQKKKTIPSLCCENNIFNEKILATK